MFVIGGKDPIWRGKLFSSCLSSTALTGGAGNAIPGTLRNPPFGMVLHWPSANEASHSPFINVLKTATEWRSSPQSGQTQMDWSALVAGGHISPTGTVNSIPAGQDNLVMAALGYMEASSGASGR